MSNKKGGWVTALYGGEEQKKHKTLYYKVTKRDGMSRDKKAISYQREKSKGLISLLGD
jgi:hypothetical protein